MECALLYITIPGRIVNRQRREISVGNSFVACFFFPTFFLVNSLAGYQLKAVRSTVPRAPYLAALSKLVACTSLTFPVRRKVQPEGFQSNKNRAYKPPMEVL